MIIIEGLTDNELLQKLREDISAESSAAAWGRLHGVSETLISLTLSGQRSISEKISHALGYEKKSVWTPLHFRNGGA